MYGWAADASPLVARVLLVVLLSDVVSGSQAGMVSLHMLDTRLIGRDQEVDIVDLAGLKGAAAQGAAYSAFTSPKSSCSS